MFLQSDFSVKQWALPANTFQPSAISVTLLPHRTLSLIGFDISTQINSCFNEKKKEKKKRNISRKQPNVPCTQARLLFAS